MKDIILSIKYKYAKAIIEGQKQYEFRGWIWKDNVRYIYLYSSEKIHKIIARFKIKQIINDKPNFTAPKFQTPKPDLNSKKSSKYLKHFAQVKQHLTYLFVNFDNKTYQVLDNLVFHETSFCYKTLYTHL